MQRYNFLIQNANSKKIEKIKFFSFNISKKSCIFADFNFNKLKREICQ